MFTLNFIQNRQIGSKANSRVRVSDLSLDIDHLFTRFLCLKKNVFTVFGEDSEVPPFACKFRKDSFCDTLAVAAEDGMISLYNTRSNAPESTVASFNAHNNAIWDIAWLPDKCQLVTGSGDLTAALFDMKSFQKIATFSKHTESVKSVDVCHEQSAIFATGSRDGCIYVWDNRDRSCVMHGKPSISICQAHCRNVPVVSKKQGPKGSISSVSAVAFQDSNNLASAGVIDGVVKIWDLRKTYIPNPKNLPVPKHKLNYAVTNSHALGCTSLVFDSLYKTLYACTTGNKVFRFDCHRYSSNNVAVYEGFSCATYFVKAALSKNDQYLLCGSSDNKAYIWKAAKPGLPIVQLPGHDAEVTAVAWSPYDETKLVTCGDDDKIAVWKMGNKEAFEESEIFSEAEAYSGTSKNSNPVYTPSEQSFTHKSAPVKASQSVQTPRKPVISPITNFFSPLAGHSHSGEISPQSKAENFNMSETIHATTPQKHDSPSTSTSANQVPTMDVLTPCNLSHINSSQSLSNKSLCDIEACTSKSQASLGPNKENSRAVITPETSKRNSKGQTKRKGSPKDFYQTAKKSSQSSSSRNRNQSGKASKQSPSGKTIMSYFSVIPTN